MLFLLDETSLICIVFILCGLIPTLPEKNRASEISDIHCEGSGFPEGEGLLLLISSSADFTTVLLNANIDNPFEENNVSFQVDERQRQRASGGYKKDDAAGLLEANILRGVSASINSGDLVSGSRQVYVLGSTSSSNLSFNRLENGNTVPANKAYYVK